MIWIFRSFDPIIPTTDYTEVYKILNNRLHAACGGGQTELRRGIRFEITSEFCTAQYSKTARQ